MVLAPPFTASSLKKLPANIVFEFLYTDKNLQLVSDPFIEQEKQRKANLIKAKRNILKIKLVSINNTKTPLSVALALISGDCPLKDDYDDEYQFEIFQSDVIKNQMTIDDDFPLFLDLNELNKINQKSKVFI